MKYIAILLFGLCAVKATAQQDPLYSQYFNNPMLINPAFAGSIERLYAGLAYRSQWAGIDGGPTTFNFNAHMPLTNQNLAVGAIAMQDKIGDQKNTTFSGSVAYRIKLKSSTFSFGMNAGMVRFSTDLNAVRVLNPDPLFAPYSESKFNTGVGVLLKSDAFAVGLSVPQLLPNTVSQGGQSIKVSGQTFYLFGSYNYFFNEHIVFKPSVLLRGTQGIKPSIDINATMTWDQLYSAGIFARNFNTYGILLQGIFNDIRIGYVFEIPGKGSALNYNTHELSLAIGLKALPGHYRTATGF
jgi:type IX secretion system PorP/SprF family membrane protein